MPLTDADYNGFADSLTTRFAERARGLDDGSARIVGSRPADHILSGFLTPVHEAVPLESSTGSTGDGEEARDELLATDLPQDSSYEQTNVGLEWIAPLTSLGNCNVAVTIDFHVYVRRFPTLAEQRQHGVWRGGNIKSDGKAESSDERVSNLIPVWTREVIATLSATILLNDLKENRRLSVNLEPDIRTAAELIDKTNLYQGRRPIQIAMTDAASDTAYAQKLNTLKADGLQSDWAAVLDARLVAMPTEPGCVGVALRLVNKSENVGPRSLDFADPNLYAVRMQARVPKQAHKHTIFQELPASFRYDRRMSAIGINSQIDCTDEGAVWRLSVNTIPKTVVPRLEPRSVADANPFFEALATDPIPILKKIHEAMSNYNSTSWTEKLVSLNGMELVEASDARLRYEEEIVRFARGVELLSNESYPLIRRAFSLMNRAMQISAAPHIKWHLFQIVFIVSQLPGLAAREYSELRREDDGYIDILWFAAGGGKTEAFLGLIVWQAFFDRLRGKSVGVTSFVRFPLRLLTFQQLQRLGRAIGAAELIRKSESISGARFSIGYFVGKGVTPNKVTDVLHSRYSSRGVDERLQIAFQCPFCRSKVSLSYFADLRLVEHRCTNVGCPGGQERLPIYVVDDDIYRFLPTVIVSTVDKLALIGQNQRFTNLFGRFDLVCHKHGASFKGINRGQCSAAQACAKGEKPETCQSSSVSYGPFHDAAPALLVQDELHLLSEELGTFDAHYETGAMEVASSLGASPWKVIAATATIENYRHQAWHLYLRKARQFPGPGPGAYESFYYCQDGSKAGRIFVGVLGVGRKHTPAVTRTLSLLYLELQAARELGLKDPARFAEVYGTHLLTAEEQRELIFLYELPLTYVLTRKGSDQVAEAIESRVKREIRELAPAHGELLVDMFNGGVDIAEMIEAMERIRSASPATDPQGRIRGLVTTNIIGHGVDVDRFNIIVFAGFTRLVAEYIQASARVGRKYPGISIFVATPQSERDRSIFDRFLKFHEYVDRLVDPTAINRWPEPALLRTVPGLLCAYLMGVAASRIGVPLPTVESVLDEYGKVNAEALNETEIVDWMKKAYGTSVAPSPHYLERLATRVRNDYSSIVNTPRRHGRPRALNIHLPAMRSLRDIDDPAYVKAIDPIDQAILKGFMNG